MEETKFGTTANQRQNSWIISLTLKHLVFSGFLFMLVTNSTCIKRRESLVTTNINHNLGDNVAEGTVTEPKCHFQHWQVKMQ